MNMAGSTGTDELQGVNKDDASLPDKFNNFFACFQASNRTYRGKVGSPPLSAGPAVIISAADTRGP